MIVAASSVSAPALQFVMLIVCPTEVSPTEIEPKSASLGVGVTPVGRPVTWSAIVRAAPPGMSVVIANVLCAGPASVGAAVMSIGSYEVRLADRDRIDALGRTPPSVNGAAGALTCVTEKPPLSAITTWRCWTALVIAQTGLKSMVFPARPTSPSRPRSR